MTTWASSGQIKIDRAAEHVHDLARRIDAFRNADPYEIVRNDDPEGWKGTVLTIRVHRDIPTEWSAIVADAIHNLGCALDHLWKNATGAKPDSRKNYFPATTTADELKATLRREKKSAANTARQLLDSLDALRDNNPFWAIRKFDDADKHHAISLVACRLQSFAVDLTHIDGERLDEPKRLVVDLDPKPDLTVVEDGAVLARLANTHAEIDIYDHLAFEIAFGKGEILEGKAVLPTLESLTTAVQILAGAFLAAGLIT